MRAAFRAVHKIGFGLFSFLVCGRGGGKLCRLAGKIKYGIAAGKSVRLDGNSDVVEIGRKNVVGINLFFTSTGKQGYYDSGCFAAAKVKVFSKTAETWELLRNALQKISPIAAHMT